MSPSSSGLPARRPGARRFPDHVAARQRLVPAGIVDAHADVLAFDVDHHAAHPFAPGDADAHLAANVLAALRDRGARLGGGVGARAHHLGSRAGRAVALPNAGIDVAARPPVDAVALAPVAGKLAVVALTLPRAAAPHVAAVAFLRVGREPSFVAVT